MRSTFTYSIPSHNPVWVGINGPAPTRSKRKIRCKKAMLTFWFSRYDVVHWKFFPENTIVISRHVTAELPMVKAKAASLSGWLSNSTVLWDNASPHVAKTTQAALTRHGFKTISHPPYSPVISPCDYHCFPSIQHFCDGQQFRHTTKPKPQLTRGFSHSQQPSGRTELIACWIVGEE